LSHTSSPFCSGYFEGWRALELFAWTSLNHDSPDLSSYDYRYEPPYLHHQFQKNALFVPLSRLNRTDLSAFTFIHSCGATPVLGSGTILIFFSFWQYQSSLN
jgi:hypothetical protein